MKKQDDLGLGASILGTISFAVMAILTYQSNDDSTRLFFLIPLGVTIAFIVAAINALKNRAKEEQQEKFAKYLNHDSSFGEGDLKLYFNSLNRKVIICATTTSGASEKIIENFKQRKSVATDNHIVSLDSLDNKVFRVKNDNGRIAFAECCINDELKRMGVILKPSAPTIKAYNDYAFVTDDINEFVTVVTPSKIHVLRYSDIVSISYEENGNNVYNKSIGGAVVGGLLFGGVGAIVGGNTAKATENKEVRNMSLKILLKSTSKPTIILKIFEAGLDGVMLTTKKDADRRRYEDLMKDVSSIKDIFSIIIDIVEKNIAMQKSTPVAPVAPATPVAPVAPATPVVPVAPTPIGVADELTKLAKLKESGILSEEEFQAQKSKLLGL